MSNDNKKIKKIMAITTAVIGGAYIALRIIGNKKKGNSVYSNEPEQQNKMTGKKVVFIQDDKDPVNADGVRGHLEAVGGIEYTQGFYEKYVKRAIDVVLSFGGLVVLSPIYAGIALAIVIDDPGPVLFTQKRVGQNKEYFKLHNLRAA
ncbi:MAG: sugar transferase [Lachnospiraceae bacterium]|nr:sugar transferase [Lachnospiraceae bacterium]